MSKNLFVLPFCEWEAICLKINWSLSTVVLDHKPIVGLGQHFKNEFTFHLKSQIPDIRNTSNFYDLSQTPRQPG